MNWSDYQKLLWSVIKDEGEESIINKLKDFLNNSRCSKYVYEGSCQNFDKGDCKKYKRDPPDGGYYG